MRPVISVLVFGLVGLGCSPTAEAPPPPQRVRTTYKLLTGVSMGGVGASALGFSNPDRFDGVAAQGGPLDAALFLRALSTFAMGGFCPRERLEQILATAPEQLNDPKVIDACAQVHPTIEWEHQQSFNRLHYSLNGTNFDRDTSLDMFSDITLGFGNLFYENPASPYAPNGVDPERLRHPPADFCRTPTVVKGFRNLEYNPEGRYDAITFCDGQPRLYFCRATGRKVDFCSDPSNLRTPLPAAQEAAFAAAACAAEGGAQVANKSDDPLFMLNHAGAVDPCREAVRPMTIGLALDLNGNRRRDYGEPLVGSPWERFDDVGADGCASAFEDGAGGCRTTADPSAVDPNGDDYHVDRNPLGTEANWLRDEGEPFRDHGLDGVPGTLDFGEGNGVFDTTSGVRRLLAADARTRLRAMEPQARARLDVLVDGGIRDMANLGLMARHLFALVRALRGEAASGYYRDFLEIPGMKDSRSGLFNPWNNRWRFVPRNLAVLYGKDAPTDQDRIEGEGDHVGTNSQAVHRFYTLFNWAAASWPNLERPATPYGGASASERQKLAWFTSKALGGAKREYAIALPPGYDAPENADKRYPVMVLLHGYGMDPLNFMGTSLIADAYVTDTDVKLRPMIMVFPSGRCCFVNIASGARDCRETDDQGRDLSRVAGWERECHSGTFYVNRQGYTGQDAVAYGDSLFELLQHVDETYRTLPTAEVDAR